MPCIYTYPSGYSFVTFSDKAYTGYFIGFKSNNLCAGVPVLRRVVTSINVIFNEIEVMQRNQIVDGIIIDESTKTVDDLELCGFMVYCDTVKLCLCCYQNWHQPLIYCGIGGQDLRK